MKNKIEEAIKLYGLAGVHPAANIPPYMSNDEYQELVKDVEEKGFLHPIRVTSEKLLIDGRNRLCASVDAGVDVSIEIFDPTDPVGYVLSENKRRNLTVGQKAAIGLAVKEYYAEEAKKRQREHGGTAPGKPKTLPDNCPEVLPKESDLKDSRDQAGKVVGISGKSIDRVEMVKRESPETFEDVKSGKVSLNAAVKEVKEKVTIKNNSKFNETNDNIEWAPYSWNPVTGCKMGCKYCYARDIGMRFNGTFEPEIHKDRFDAPKNTKWSMNKSKNVFVCSMADLFGDWVPEDWILKVFETCKKNEQWNFLFLTKNPKRYLEFIGDIPKNSWIGATADIQLRADLAIQAFKKLNEKNIPNIKFLSCEPLLENINIEKNIIDWLIIGGQSKTSGSPAFQPDWSWVENLILQCINYKIPYYFKPNLTIRPKMMP